MNKEPNIEISGKTVSCERENIQEILPLLERDKKDRIACSQYNFETVLDKHPLLQGIKSDSFSHRIIVVKPLPWDPVITTPREWTNADDAELQSLLAIHFKLDNPIRRNNAFNAIIARRAFHPVQEYLNSIQWDGQTRMDTLFIDYLGAEDTVLTRALTRKWLVAAVTRIFNPGCKFDNILTLSGPEGIGKSRILGYLSGNGTSQDWFTDSLASIETKEAGEIMQGKWIIEMGELTNYKKSTIEAYKAFLSRTTDRFREAFARRSQDFPRQCVFAATTNESSPLKGDTGNRRFWIIYAGRTIPKAATLEDLNSVKDFSYEKQVSILCKKMVSQVIDNRDQIWAEAVAAFKAGEPLYLSPELEDMARVEQEEANEISCDPRIGLIESYLRIKLPPDWETLTIPERKNFIQHGGGWYDKKLPFSKRTKVCTMEIIYECLGEPIGQKSVNSLARDINKILKGLSYLTPGVDDLGRARHISFGPYGKQQPYYIQEQKQTDLVEHSISTEI